ncbi:hypothetical protein JXA32_06395 [Candidatus Sumerlaeota bacterium]|nr:hypothetical protein [Candidatus Sumerlaeota bacterium]
MMRKTLALIIAALLAIPMLGAIVSTSTDDVQEIAEPMAQSVIDGLENDDYDAFSKYFAARLKVVLTESRFKTQQSYFEKNLGSLANVEYLGHVNYTSYTRTIFKAYASTAEQEVLMWFDIDKRTVTVSGSQQDRYYLIGFEIQPPPTASE